ncbi:MAG: restriction endonuclease subunit S [Candidatus Nanohaloarchaea archaeon]
MISKEEIPEHWDWSDMKSEVYIEMGNSPPGDSYNEEGNGEPFLQGASRFGEKYPSEGKYTTEPTKFCEEEDILITIRAGVGELNVADKEYCIGRGIAALRGEERVNNDYLFYYLKTLKPYWEEVSSGSTYSSITKKNIKNAPIPVPPLEEQEMIVEKLDEIFDSIEEIQDAQEQAREIRDILLESAIHHKYGNLEGKEKDLDDVVKILMGSSPPGESYNEEGEGKPFIQGASKFSDKYPTEGKFTTDPERLCQKDDVLITIRAGVGDLNIADKEYCIGRGIAGLRPQEISRDYLYFYLKGMKNYWEQVSSGSTYQSITKKNLKNAPITVVSEEKQKEVVNFLRQIEDNLVNLTKEFDQSEEKTEDLPKSVLAEAFKGKLVDFEPEEALEEFSEESSSENEDPEKEVDGSGQQGLDKF